LERGIHLGKTQAFLPLPRLAYIYIIEGMDGITLSIVIVNFQARSLLEKCIISVLASGIRWPFEMFVVDNDSKDGSEELIAERFPEVRLIKNHKNVGFARAANSAFIHCKGRYLLVLNPDIEVSIGAINSLLDYMESRPKVALASPKLLNSDGTLQYSCRTYYSFYIAMMRRTILGKLFPNHRIIRDHLMMDWDHADTREVDWVLGGAMMLRRQAFSDQQVMDERFFLYFEDVDLCLRLRKAGWKVMYYPDAVMVHHHQRASAMGIWNHAKFEHIKSWVKFLWKHRHEQLLRLSRNRTGD
jgi:GT2 family glycosyltransferase